MMAATYKNGAVNTHYTHIHTHTDKTNMENVKTVLTLVKQMFELKLGGGYTGTCVFRLICVFENCHNEDLGKIR